MLDTLAYPDAPGAKVTRKPRSAAVSRDQNEEYENNQIRSVTKPTPIDRLIADGVAEPTSSQA